MAESKARIEWTRKHTTYLSLKLNNHTDADILNFLAGKPVQTTIKEALRYYIAARK